MNPINIIGAEQRRKITIMKPLRRGLHFLSSSVLADTFQMKSVRKPQPAYI